MIIEISAIALVFVLGYFVGNLRKRPQKGQKIIKKHKVHLSRSVSHNIRIISSIEQKDDEKQDLVEIRDEEKPLNKKKKNKKKKKQKQREMQQGIKGRGQQYIGESNNQQQKQRSQSHLYESTTIPSLSQRGQLQVQSKSSHLLPTSNNNKKQLQQFNPSQQQCTDFVNDEIQLLRNYFLYELQQVIPYSKSYGKYRVVLIGTCKQVTLEWSYHIDSSNRQQNQQPRGYPRQLIQIKFIYDNLKPIEIDKLNQIANQQKMKFLKYYQNHQLYNYIFNLSTAIYQDLLMQIVQQPEQNLSLLQNTKHYHHKDSIINHKTLNNTQHYHDTSQLFTVEKKQIYGKLFQEIFYMQDFKSQPNESLLIYNHAETVQKKHHFRGRYINEFQELEMIGKGGFGKVYKAKNRLDSNTYAIKKIAINYQNSKDRKLLNEVTFFSTLNHPNIVRYHQSWLQDISSMDELIHDMSIVQLDEKEELQHLYEDWRKSAGMGGIFFQDHSKENKSKGLFINRDSDNNQSEQDDIMFQEDDDIRFEGYSQIQFEENSKSCSISNPHKKMSFPHLQDSSQVEQNQKSDFPFKILYIVMEFVRGITLREFINTRFKEDEIKIQIIRGILEGLAYIHSKKIIHRDLKPANIFLTQNNKVKIGDFGLATTGTLEQKVAHEMYEKSNNNYVDFQKTIGIGTAFYRAPQQIKSPKYDEKVDIYSLGIIIFEMFYEFSTYSERFKILSDITKTFTLPKDFNLYGQLTDYQINIENCIKEQPEIRPTAIKLLQNFRNKYFVHLVSAIANPKYAQFYQLIKQLFQISNQRRVQSVKRNYFRSYDFQQILNIYRIHRGNIFQSFPLIFTNDFKTLNGMKIQFNQARKQKLLVLSQQGVLLQYTSSLYAPWIIYAKQTMKKRKHEFMNDQLAKVGEIRRFAFEKIVDAQYDTKKDENVFKQKYVTGFDICYDLQGGFSQFLTLQMLVMSSNIVDTLHLTQQNPPLYICHSKVFTILSKHYKIPPYKLYTCLLSTSEQKFSSMTQQKKLQHLEKYQIQGITAKKISQLFQHSFDQFTQWINSFQIWNIDQYSEYWQINEQIKKVTMLNEHFELKSIQYKLMVPPNYCHGLFWNHGPLKGFTSIEDYTIGSMIGNFCNLNIQLTLTQSDQICDVSIWSNQQFLQSQIMQLVSKCWQMGVSAKYYEKGIGEKDDSSKMNMIIRKKKGERVHYHIRKNENRKYNNKIKPEQTMKQTSSVVVKQQFNHQVFKQIHNHPGTMTNLFNLSKKKTDTYVH